MDPRSFNGPEEAHDYLWLTQDLWMEDDVWNWVNGHPDAKATILKTCSRKECFVKETSVAQFKRCAACHLVGSFVFHKSSGLRDISSRCQVSYCGQACQKLDWKEHKPGSFPKKSFVFPIVIYQHQIVMLTRIRRRGLRRSTRERPCPKISIQSQPRPTTQTGARS